MSTNLTASGGVRSLLRWMLALLLLATSQVALAAYCPTPKSATVNSGGSVSFEVGDCDGPSNFGMTDPGVPLRMARTVFPVRILTAPNR
ncbi:hypothetical protein PUV44_10925 [Xanthomonas arboricola pv. corylina]|nr:hypothetical protein PUV44_10925 [Xanthomonas arboricola pv. corylina]